MSNDRAQELTAKINEFITAADERSDSFGYVVRTVRIGQSKPQYQYQE